MTITKALTTVTDRYQPRKRHAKATKVAGATTGQSLSGEPPPGTIDPGSGRSILSKARTLPTADNLSWLRRFAIGLLTRHPSEGSIQSRSRMAGWSNEFLMEVLAAQRV